MKKNLWIAIIALTSSFAFVACGVQEDEDTDAPDVVTPADPADPADPDVLPDVFRSPAACVLDFSSHYVSGAKCGELRGDIRGTVAVSWTAGLYMLDSDNSGYLGMAFTDAPDAGTYNVSYIGLTDCSTHSATDSWAQYGLVDDLRNMTAEARSFIQCNWWDAINRVMFDSDPSSTKCVGMDGQPCGCNIRIKIDAACNIGPAGNMANLVE